MKRFENFKELKAGKCKVVATNGREERLFEGSFDDKLKVLFFAIPSTWEVIGYIQ